MKKLIKNLCIYLLFAILLSSNLYSQDQCGTQDFPYGQAPYANNFFGGYLKPQRTDYSDGVYIPYPQNLTATLNMLFVFVQFQDENKTSDEWPINYPPTFMDKFLVKNKNSSGDFWNRYKDSSLSDYYQEISKGAFHVTGESRHLKMYHTWNYYKDTVFYNGFLTEIYQRLGADTTINWEKFDLWSRNDPPADNYIFTKDKYLDMMGIFVRDLVGADFVGFGGELGNPGYVPLHGPTDYVIYKNANDTVKIGSERDKFGSGFVAKGTQGPLGFYRSLGIAIHEYGHYLFSNVHSTSGIMTSNGGISINDLFMSGFEKYKLGLLDTLTANFNQSTSYSIRDISGRNGSSQSPDFPQILRIPITNTDYFIIENRRKISSWDVYMLGDTSKLDPFRPTGDYGKGIYIYHSNNIGLNYTGNVDMECADGLWNWSNYGYEHPDWSDESTVLVKLRDSLPTTINNDPGTLGFNNYVNADGISAGPWFSKGKKHASVGLTGTDRIFSNSTEYWTSRERFGDRYDAWNVGYNQVFSPYSNPNTKTYSNGESGIFIYYNSLVNGIANIKVYKIDEPFILDSILKWTPPSKPMGIVVDYYFESENYMRPKITWNHNMEPDMMRISDSTKKYKIWRATQTSMYYVPTNYTLIATKDIYFQTAPSFIDTSIIGYGSGWPGMGEQIQYPVRYKVQAIDKYADSSVRSDFGSAIGLRNCGAACITSGDSILSNLSNEELPKEYSINQNYPNPFNPTTNIQYEIPFDNFVNIKIYNLLGKEIMSLVDDLKKAGRYEISFDGSNLPSGVYYYKISSGNFEQIRKMVLIK
ncbi:MAG: T9SS type A sorting domain-containing protein [Ignavibacteria bacterium]|nr:T9SS type A sorting domain-containing protein [Ignavibacteria bacterium]